MSRKNNTFIARKINLANFRLLFIIDKERIWYKIKFEIEMYYEFYCFSSFTTFFPQLYDNICESLNWTPVIILCMTRWIVVWRGACFKKLNTIPFRMGWDGDDDVWVFRCMFGLSLGWLKYEHTRAHIKRNTIAWVAAHSQLCSLTIFECTMGWD